MTDTPRGSPELVAAQALPETTVNEQIRRTEAGAGRFPVADRVAAPPGTCADGANYIIIATATGDFAGKENQIATAVGTNAASGWLYRTLGTIDEGVVAYVQDEDVEYKWSGSAWATYAGSFTAAAASDVWNGTNNTKTVTPKSIFDSAAVQTLTDGATITPDFGAGLNFKVTLGGNRTLANPSNAKDGQSGVIRITQDGTGSRTLTYGSNWRFPGGAASGGVLSTAAGAVDQIAYIVGSSGIIYATLSKAFAA